MSALRSRKGAIAVLAAVLLSLLFAFVAFGIDSGRIVTERTRMQNAVDAAALAASQEIVKLVRENGNGGSVGSVMFAENQARQVAAEVAAANGVYVDPLYDVEFGHRFWHEANEEWHINWRTEPYNVVRVVARRDNPEPNQPDSEFPLAFGWAVGSSNVALSVRSAAYIESRDMVLVLDFSASMNDDSSLRGASRLGLTAVETSLDGMWDSLVDSNAVWPNSSEPKFPRTGFGNLDSYEGVYLSSDDTSTVLTQLGLLEVSGDEPVHPFPQSGRDSSGFENSRPSVEKSEALWRDYVNFVKNRGGTYNKTYGYRTLMDYLQERRYHSNRSEDLWRTPHYPFHAVKQGAEMFTTFLDDLDFGDQLGLVSYGGYSKKETHLFDNQVSVDLRADPITDDYVAINEIQTRKQAGHYNGWTGMGYGIHDARELLYGDPANDADEGHARYGARPTIILMTDGRTNQGPSDWALPSDFDWAKWTDFDEDGIANYTTDDYRKQYAFWEATEAIKLGITIHTMSVGAGADRELMKAIAFAGNGFWVDVPGGTSVEEMQSEVLQAFGQMAASVPQPQLIYEDDPLFEKVNGRPKGNNGVGNGVDDQPPGDPPVNDDEGDVPGDPGNKQLGKQ